MEGPNAPGRLTLREVLPGVGRTLGYAVQTVIPFGAAALLLKFMVDAVPVSFTTASEPGPGTVSSYMLFDPAASGGLWGAMLMVFGGVLLTMWIRTAPRV